MKNAITFILISALFLASCSAEKKLVRKAGNAIAVSDFDKANAYYDQALARNPDSYRANAGKGILLSEYMGRYDQAIPYLEKALKKSPEEVRMKLNDDLGKSYHYVGNYSRALYYYEQVKPENTPDNAYYDPILSKRIADCHYALEHPQVAPAEQQYATNAGPTINTSDPEYGPVYTNGTLIFTAKRKDTPHEKKNNIDGRYFESMYISTYKDGAFSTPRRYTIPDLGENSNFHKGNESAVTVLDNGKTLYLFRGGELYQADLTDPAKEPEKLSGKANFMDFHPYAFVTKDGHTMYLVSESTRDGGGTDIYQAFKKDDGSWGTPLLLPFSINTDANEDAPYMAEDGTLYFASNGLPGYGGYDIYKTRYVGGEWTTPVNLGQPINTPADDIYFTLNPYSANGFYATNRMGGQGDMDIYHVHYASGDVPDCATIDTLFVINEKQDGEPYAYTITAEIPDQYKGRVRSVTWKVDDVAIPGTSETITYVFDEAKTYKVSAKAIVYCDTCPSLQVVCTEKLINMGLPEFTRGEYEQPLLGTPNYTAGELDNSQLAALGWSTTPCYFDYDKSDLREESKAILDQNINVLKTNKELSIVINGYADARGTHPYNKNLSAQRIRSVRNYLIQHGIPSRRITDTKPYGETMISNGCVDDVECTEEKHQENRKVDFKVSNNRLLYTRVTIQN
jgi:outer membrane protein OmpA-like peptidoglycan-associated protein/tetratricopeptide (TPR) repeat protein